MAIIRCPQCNHEALYIADELIKSKISMDRIRAEDFTIILSWADSRFKEPQVGDPIRCHKCKTDLGAAIHKSWKEFPREREWEE